MIDGFFAGARYFWRGLSLINTRGLRGYALLPIAVNVVVFTALVWFAADRFDAWMASLIPGLPGWLAWLSGLLWLMFAALVLVVIFFTFTAVANLIGGPFNGLFAEAVERHLTGTAQTSGLGETLRQIPATLIDELRKLGYYARFALPLLVLSFIPVLNLAAPLLWAVFGAWMLAVEYADYPLGNRGLRGAQVRAVLRAHRPAALGFGAAALLAMLVPGLNLLVMPVAVAGATALTVERFRTDG